MAVVCRRGAVIVGGWSIEGLGLGWRGRHCDLSAIHIERLIAFMAPGQEPSRSRAALSNGLNLRVITAKHKS